MTFRARLLAASMVLALVPLVLFAGAVRREVDRRLSEQYGRSTDALVEAVRSELARQSVSIDARLEALGSALADDNRFRLAAVQDAAAERGYLLDRAGAAMAAAGFDVLQIQDEQGRILSSGHFRNEYGRVEPGVPAALARAGERVTLLAANTPSGTLPALVRARTFSVGARRFTLVGGVRLDATLLRGMARDPDATISVVYPGGALSSHDSTAAALERDPAARPQSSLSRTLALPFVAPDDGAAAADSAVIIVTQSLAPLVALRRGIDLRLLAGLAVTALLAFALARWLAGQLSRPLTELARRATRVNLEHEDPGFATSRSDEIGTLSRMLDAMVKRLRARTALLRQAERRATVGEVARQVNHDVRNGLTPIRNVVEHLAQLARESPDALPDVFLQRQATLDASIAYLHALATNYARLSPRLERSHVDVNAIARAVAADARTADGGHIVTALAPGAAAVLADPVALRRIVQNLVSNALEALGPAGTVTVRTRHHGTRAEPRVIIEVEDDGEGIAPERLERVFDDFYTTRERGTGLGLSIVRRLVADLGGTVRAESEPGRGTRFHIELPGLGDVRRGPADARRAPAKREEPA